MILITPDGERTMNTYLGACHELTEARHPRRRDRRGADHLHGRLSVGSAGGQEGLRQGRRIRPQARPRHRHHAQRSVLRQPLSAANSSISCARAPSTTSLPISRSSRRSTTPTTSARRCARSAADCKIAAVTMGAKGAMAIRNGEIFTVPAYPGRAGGRRHRRRRSLRLRLPARHRPRTWTPNEALQLGCMAASEVISHVGARPQRNLADMAREFGSGLGPATGPRGAASQLLELHHPRWCDLPPW